MGLDLDPDVVVIAVGFNDTGEARPTKRRSFARNLSLSDSEYASAVRRSNRFGVLRLAYRLRGTSSGDDSPEPGVPIEKIRVSADEYRDNLRVMIESCRSREMLPVMLVWPHRYQAVKQPVAGRWEMVEAYQRIARDVARAHRIPLVDGVEVIQGHGEYFFDSVHLNPTGYTAVAHAVAAALAESPPIGR